MKKYIPIAIVVLSNTVYHIAAKGTSQSINAFASLIITYIVGLLCCLVLFYTTSEDKSLRKELKKVNWATFVLGICIAFLEFGNIMMYKVGWDISVGSLVSNISLAVVLILIGVFFYKEKLSKRKITGMLLCAAGFVMINL